MSRNPTYILGISAFYHDSAACLVKDGQIVAAAQEERFTRKKHDPDFPRKAIDYCLNEAGISINDVTYVGYYEKPFIKFERLLFTYLTYAPRGLRSFLKAMPIWFKEKIFLKDFLQEQLKFNGKILFVEHHESHAASAFYPSPFKEAAILTMDGVGEWTTTSFGVGKGSAIELHSEIKFPHSLGLLYSAFTYYTGFRVNSGEYKLMGLAPYGEPKYVDQIKEHLIDIKPDGSFRLNMDYFNYCVGLTMTNKKFDDLFGGPPRAAESKIRQKDMDLARSIQEVTEEVMLKVADHVHEKTGQKNLCLAGGVALNCVGNGRILREGKFENIWIQPAAGDAGGALGVALDIWFRYLDNPRAADDTLDKQAGSYLGPRFDKSDIRTFLEKEGLVFEEVDAIAEKVAEVLDDEKVVGLFQGRMEFGPRALGGRSILGDPRSTKMQSILNQKIKFRESFRPFAPSVLNEEAKKYFELEAQSPYMLLVAPLQEDQRTDTPMQGSQGILEKLMIKRSTLPAITHVDYSARVQTVTHDTNPMYYDIIQAFHKRTGCPVVINTSFNVRGEPIVCTPEDAVRCFMRTNMDYLVLENFILAKDKQKDKDKYINQEISLILD